MRKTFENFSIFIGIPPECSSSTVSPGPLQALHSENYGLHHCLLCWDRAVGLHGDGKELRLYISSVPLVLSTARHLLCHLIHLIKDSCELSTSVWQSSVPL